MTDAILLIAWCVAIIYISVVVHELGHAWMGRLSGWTFVRFDRRWYGMAAVLDMNGDPGPLRRVAAAGLVSTLVLTTFFHVAASVTGGMLGWAFGMAFVLNAVLLATNLIPLVPLDAGLIVRRR